MSDATPLHRGAAFDAPRCSTNMSAAVDLAVQSQKGQAMRNMLVCLLGVFIGVTTTACTTPVEEICDLSADAPKVKKNIGTASRSDGEPFEKDATWTAGPSGSVTIGALDMIIVREESGVATDELIEDGRFPICVRLGERGEKTGAANYVDGGYVTNADHTGTLAILSNDDGQLVGRFAVDLAAGQDELSFADGVFSARQR